MSRPDPDPAPRRALGPMGAAMSLIVIFVAVLTIPLRAETDLGLTTGQATAWIMALYGIPAVLGLLLTFRYRQPLLLTGNVFVIIFVARLGDGLVWGELIGASVAAGVLVLVVGLAGLTDRISVWLPEPIVYGLLAGAVLPFVTSMLTALGDAPLLIGVPLITYLVARAVLGGRVPAILPALVAGVIVAGLAGEFGSVGTLSVPAPEFTAPVLSLDALLTVTPVLFVLVTVQANVPSVVFLRDVGYTPPEKVVAVTSGLGTAAGSFMGPIGVSLSLPATALIAGPGAGEPSKRHRGVYMAESAAVAIALLAGVAAVLVDVVPAALLTGLVGLAVLEILTHSIREAVSGPLILGPTFAFAIALSGLSMLGLGPFLWAIVGGVTVSLLLERDQLRARRAGPPTTDGA